MCTSVFCPFVPCAHACVHVLRQGHPSQTVSSVGRSLVFLSLPWLSTGKCALQTVLRTSWEEEEEEEERGLASLFIGDESLLKLTPNFHTTPATPSTCCSEVATFPFSGCGLNHSSFQHNPPLSCPVSIHFSASDLRHSHPSSAAPRTHQSVSLSPTIYSAELSLGTSSKMLSSLQSASPPS